MRGKITLMLLALMMMSCSKDWTDTDQNLDYSYGRRIPHGKIVLGDRLENPYTTENITKALHSLYPTKGDRVDVKMTDLYVRFLPDTDEELETLAGTILSWKVTGIMILKYRKDSLHGSTRLCLRILTFRK